MHPCAILTLEYSRPVSSPVAPGLTSPRVVRSRVLQASSTSKDVLRVLRVLLESSNASSSASSSLPSTFLGCIKAMRCSSYESLLTLLNIASRFVNSPAMALEMLVGVSYAQQNRYSVSA